MKFLVFSVYRKTHDRHLTPDDLKMARATARALGSFNDFILKGGDTARVHSTDIETDTQEKAVRLYKETHQGAEVFACEPVGA